MVEASRAARVTGISPVVGTAGGSVGFAGQARPAGAGGAAPDPPDGPRPLPQFAARGPIRVGGELARVEPVVGGTAHDLDLPGVVEDDVELTVERNVVTIRAHRAPARQDGDEVIIDERPYGEFIRQLFLGDNLDAGRMTADLRDGVLRLTIPVSEESKPRRIPLGSSGDQRPAEIPTSSG